MRRYFVAGALILVAGLGTFFAIGGGPGHGPSIGRIQRAPRYGGRAWPPPNSSATVSPPALLIANGTGMGTPCSGTNPTTAATGQTITYPPRASHRTCMKAGEFDGITEGDLVDLSDDQYAIQPGGDGTGALGISIAPGSINYARASEALNNVFWTKYGSGAAAPTVTADFALSPRNDMTAERIQFPATDVGQVSEMYAGDVADPCSGTGNDSISVFIKKNGAGTATTVLAHGGGSGGWDTKTVTVNGTSWTRVHMAGSRAANASLLVIGNYFESMAATDLLVWGVQCEAGDSVTPYIATTTGATAARVADGAPTVSLSIPSTVMCLGGTFVAPWSFAVDAPAVVSASFTKDYEVALPVLGSKVRCDFYLDGGHSYQTAIANLQDPASPAAADCAYQTTPQLEACLGTGCRDTAGSVALPTGTATVRIGGLRDGGVMNGTAKGISVDTTGTGCRPAGATVRSCPYDTGGDLSKQIALLGDSIMVGAFDLKVADEMNDRLCSYGRAVEQDAVSGYNIANCITKYQSTVKGRAFSAIATNCGTNTLNGLADGDAGWVQMESFLNDMKNDGGYFLIVGNVTGCQGYSGCDEGTVALFNAREAEWCADAGNRAKCLDNHTLLKNSTDVTVSGRGSGYPGTKCLPSSDVLHPDNYCTVTLADAFADAVMDAGR